MLDMNFYNPQCAECSGGKDFTNWEINLVCTVRDLNNGYLLSAMRGELNNDCEMKFTPPKSMDIPKHVCSGEPAVGKKKNILLN